MGVFCQTTEVTYIQRFRLSQPVKTVEVVKWHQQGFTLYWRWLSKSRHGGRPPIDPDVRDLIRRMARDNPTWGAPRMQSELRLLGYTVAQATVAK